ncbi:MAG: Hsp70 family protein, partial [Chthoniobacterales bacterium]
RQKVLEPARTIASVKRFMGNRDPIKIEGGNLSPEEVSAEILKHLKKIAEERLEKKIARAVITVPAYFNDAQRAATRKAGEIAGFRVERILSEPTAAALAYGLDKLHDQAKIAVYDFGGGTFDLSILQLDHGIFQVLSTHGDTKLGGDDIDTALTEFLLAKAGLKNLNALASVRLCEVARQAKEELSFCDETLVRLPFLEQETNVELPLTRNELEKIALPLIERTRAHCLEALKDAKLEPHDLDEIILVGGSTRMPAIRSFVQKIFGKAPNLTQHPDETVARGAILQGALLEGSLKNVSLLDVTPLSLGIETFGGLMNVIIPRNTTIPTKAGEMFTNAAAGQTAIRVSVLQGERELAADNWKLGEVEISFPAVAKGTARVGVQFAIDADGILQVLARDTASGKEKIVEISHAIEISDEAVEAMLADSLEHAFEDMDNRIFTEARLKAEEMLPAVESALTQLGDEIPAEEELFIRTCTNNVLLALTNHKTRELKELLQKLDDATQNLATKLVEKVMSMKPE